MSSRLDRLRREIANLPNMITVGRLFLVPPVLLLADVHEPVNGFYAMLLFLLASFLDVLDGWLARRQNLVTFFGKFVDPLADKIMVMALLVHLTADGRLPAWLSVLLLSREFYMSALRTLALGERIEIVANAGGKAKTGLQLIGISFLLVFYRYQMPFGGWIDFYEVGLMCMYASLAVSVWSAVRYTQGFVDALGAAAQESP